MANVLDILQERGFIERTTHEQELRDCLDQPGVTCYIGFDPTAASLHIGSLVPIMSLAHMQRQGHRPIALIGGGTGMVGDPSGKTEMRQLLTLKTLKENSAGIKKQLSHFLDFSQGRALLLNNADWLTKLKYIPFLRDIGRHFSVNRMIKAESYKIRLDSDEGLSFIEFNYMVLQAYDFLELFRHQDCKIQMGGSDQWGNIVAGVELVRRVSQKTVFGITFPLITTSSGDKMGKTAKGAVWLDAAKTSPYEYYQYWVNTDDNDVGRFLALFTFLPLAEIRRIEKLSGASLNDAKAVLAFEATRLAHGYQEAVQAYQAAGSMFGARKIAHDILPSSTIPRGDSITDDQTVPSSFLDAEILEAGIPAFKLFHQIGLTNSSGAARRLIAQGGAYINGARVESIDHMVTSADLDDQQTIVLRSGKKRYHRIEIKK
ncbi:MAG: tyrosine--tRNA ligase [Deltaproteobacteria bacterium]|jgi:tyrosyl-tRNA synthetase|nr:tyrosine--tRNA ligase [Deltaproteobacteria bacterium]